LKTKRIVLTHWREGKNVAATTTSLTTGEKRKRKLRLTMQPLTAWRGKVWDYEKRKVKKNHTFSQGNNLADRPKKKGKHRKGNFTS